MIFIAARLGQVIQIIIQVCFTQDIYIYQKFGGRRGGVGRTEKDMPAISPISNFELTENVTKCFRTYLYYTCSTYNTVHARQIFSLQIPPGI